MRTLHCGAVLAIATALAGSLSLVHATDYFWLGGDGSFGDDSKWQDYANPSHHESPGPSDSAVFYSVSTNYSVYLDNDYTINYGAVSGTTGNAYLSSFFGGSLTANEFRVGDYDGGGNPALADNTTLLVSGDPLDTLGHLRSTYLTVGGGATGSLWLYLGGHFESLTNGTITLGRDASSFGTLNVADAGSYLDAGESNIVVGKFGRGVLSVFNSGVAGVGELLIGAEAGNTYDNAVYVSNANSLLEADTIYVGSRGKGSLGVYSGAEVQLRDNILGGSLSVGRLVGAEGFVDVTGAGSRLDASGTAEAVFVGDFGTGTMYVHDGATADANYVFIGAQAGSQGNTYVYDANSLLTVSQLYVGHTGTGGLSITGGGKAEVSALMHIGELNTGVGTVTVSGTGSTLDALGNDITVGSAGTGSLTVSAGGQLVNTNVLGVGGGANAHNNSIQVTGTDSAVHTTHLSIGFNNSVGDSTVTVADNARMYVANIITLGARATLDTTGGAVDATDATPSAAVGSLRVGLNGFLTGAGTVKGNVLNVDAGIINVAANGTMTIDGDFTQTTGQLFLTLNGDSPGQYGHLNIMGDATWGGTLNVSKHFSFTPTAGDMFDLMSFESSSGTFNSIVLPTLTSGLTWDTSQLYTTGVVKVMGLGGLAGDFDNDGDVDGRDFLLWQRNPSVGDLADWQANYGTGSLASSATVPEPGTLLFFSLAAWPWSYFAIHGRGNKTK